MKLKKSELNYINNSLHDITNKTVIITGANSGIGFAICQVLLMKHAHIVMACRNIDRANKAKEELLKDFPSSNIEILIYDQSSLEGCKKFASDIIKEYPDFHALILNAGIIGKKKEALFENKVINTIGVNYIATSYILECLQPFLKESNIEHRIIFEGSVVARHAKYKSGQISKTNYGKFRKYNISKCGVLNIFKTYASNNDNANILYLYSEPGIANTGIIRNFPKLIQKAGYVFMSIFMHSNIMGALTTCYLAANYVANGDSFVPKHMFHTKGLPTRYNNFKKPINEEIIKDGKMIIEDIYGTR